MLTPFAACGGNTYTNDLEPVDASAVDHETPDAASGHDAADAAPPLSCHDYCARVIGACQDGVYASTAACEAQCAVLPLGSAGDRGDSIACRNAQAVRAAGGNTSACVAAEPSGEGVCGSRCDAYCKSVNALCPGSRNPFSEDCLTQCQRNIYFDDTAPEYDGQSAQNTLNCRQYFVQRMWLTSSSGGNGFDYCSIFGVQPTRGVCGG